MSFTLGFDNDFNLNFDFDFNLEATWNNVDFNMTAFNFNF